MYCLPPPNKLLASTLGFEESRKSTSPGRSACQRWVVEQAFPGTLVLNTSILKMVLKFKLYFVSIRSFLATEEERVGWRCSCRLAGDLGLGPSSSLDGEVGGPAGRSLARQAARKPSRSAAFEKELGSIEKRRRKPNLKENLKKELERKTWQKKREPGAQLTLA